MTWQTIVTLVVGVFGVVSIIVWALILTKAGKIWANMKILRDEYNSAIEDKVLTDAEKTKIADTVINIITDSANIWQAMTNMVIQILQVISKVSPPSKKALRKILKINSVMG